MTNDTDFEVLSQGLAPRFKELWRRCASVPGAESRDAWRELQQRYTESHRHYHTLHHLDYCLRELDAARPSMANANANANAIEMAIWYHDIIYELEATDNEYQSRLVFDRAADGVFDPDFVRLVGTLIMATTHRNEPQTDEERFTCDIDLSSMAAPWDRFVADGNDLWAESQSCIQDYMLGKLNFFNSLLERPRVYYSDFFHDRYEQAARENISRFIGELSQE